MTRTPVASAQGTTRRTTARFAGARGTRQAVLSWLAVAQRTDTPVSDMPVPAGQHTPPASFAEGDGWVSYPDPSRCEMCRKPLGSRPGRRCSDCEEIYEADGGDTMHAGQHAPPAGALIAAVEYANPAARDAALEAAFERTDDDAVWAQAKGSNAIARLTRKSILRAALFAAQADERERIRLPLLQVIESLDGECTFWACEGPDVEPVHMVTCRVCWAIRDLRKLADLIGGTA